MILIFHLCTNLLYHLYKKHITKMVPFSITQPNSDHPLAQRDAENEIKFDPPVYKQRYERATQVLTNPKWKSQIRKIVDFGSAELGLFVFLKNAVEATELVFVDIDDVLLRDYLYRVYPLNADYLIGRERPLSVKVYAGSVADPDPSLANTDAVVALEIIEHLYPDVLEALPYNLFGYMRPKVVVVTTPNADFNVLFEKLQKFRHEDHKFEWSREQFQSWAENITARFPRYMVCYDGVGLGPTGSETLGGCSQLAVFIRKDIICDNYVEYNNGRTCRDYVPKNSYGICTYQSYTTKSFNCPDDRIDGYYKLLASVEYPYEIDVRTVEERILDELKYRINLFGDVNGVYYNSDRNCVEIPVARFGYKSNGVFPTDPREIRALLLKNNYQIEERLNVETNEIETFIIYEPDMDSGGSSNDTDASGYGSDSNKCNPDDSQLSDSDWDDKDLTRATKDTEDPKTQLSLDVGNNKKEQAALFDSGYQKSPSVPDESPNSASVNEQPIALGFKSLNLEKPNKLSNILSVFNNFDKINELDALRKDRKCFNFSSNLPHREVMKKLCQEIAKHPVAGPSRDNRKKQTKKSPQSSDSEDSADEVKSITTCIIENSLNKIECKEEEQPHVELIHELVVEIENPPEVAEPILIVENGDLANNNRDREGNNYPENEEPVQQIDNDIDNININFDNNNEIVFEDHIQVDVEEPPEQDIPINPEVVWSSREALFDANSQVDLLEDFDIDAAASVNDEPPNCVIVDSNITNEPVLVPEDTGFPNWLLQIFEEADAEVPEDELHDEPHFYCQGDGLGVHPSIVAVNAEDDDGDTESVTDTTSSSSSGSSEFQSAETQSFQGVPVPPDDPGNDNNLVLIGQPVTMTDQSNQADSTEQETFQNAEESESNLVATGSCTQ